MLASRWLQRSSMLLCAALVMAASVASVQADTFTVTNQTEFNAAVAIATAPGRSDTIDVDVVNISSGPALMLPAAASSIVINFNGSSSGPTVYNPTLDVGYGTTGQLGVGAGTTLNFNTVNGIASLRVGVYDGVNAGQGTVNMTGGTINGIHTGPSNYFSVNVGRGSADSQGTFNQSGGSIFLNGGSLNVGADGGTGVYNMSGAALLDLGVGTVYIGTGAGGDGTLHVGGNAQFLLNESNVFGQIYIGTNGGTGTVIQDGAGSRVVLNAQSGVHFGSNGGFGSYQLSAGQLILDGLGSGTPGLDIGASVGGTGIFTQTGGTVTLNTGQIRFGVGTGRYDLNGGTLQVGVANPFSFNAGGQHTFNLGGGTIAGLVTFSTTMDFNLVGATTSAIDTAVGTSATMSGVIAGNGALEKAGDGTLILDAANTYTGGTRISDGTLQLGALGSLGSTGTVQVDSGATFDLNSHVQTIGALVGDGTVELGGVSGALTTNTAATTIFSGDISGTGSFTKAGSGTLFLTGESNYIGSTSVSGGSLVVNGSLDSVVTVASGILGGTGTIGGLIVESGGTVAPGNSIGTLNVAGGVTFQPSSTYQVEVNAAGASDLIAATGAATINGGLVQVLAQGGAYSPLMTYTILTAAAGRTGEFDGVSSNLVFLQPTLDYDANNVYLRLVRNSTDFADFAQTPNERAVAGALDQFPADAALLPFLLGQDVQGVRQAFDALSGEVHASAASALVMNSFYVREAIFSRLIQAYYSGAVGEETSLGATGPTTVALLDPRGRMSLGARLDDIGNTARTPPLYGHGLAFWTRGFGAWGNLDGNGNAAGLERTLGGFISGVDAGLGGGWRAGLATGYMHSDLGVGARASSADIDSYVLAGYVGGGAGPFAIRSGGAWTWNNLDTTRNVIFPGFFETERASYDAGTGQLFAEIAYPVVYAASAWEPFAGLSYVHVGTDGFTESGSIAGLASEGADQNVGVSLLGLRTGATLPVQGMLLTPHGSLAWQYAFGDVTPAQALTFASNGIGFGITGVPIARSSMLIEAGLDLAVNGDAVLDITYTGQIASHLNDNSVQGRFNWHF
ncbi:subtilase-type serine protease [Hyphomicrobium sp. 1Nfss2.1]|uniref:autotransporter outer membrane beta-barrel domain-containing protein n=1 Tax=Hyphomicrobium sp. 1Nfss2.1 TaxID=3413936 RepID=UPI003C7AD0F2